MTNGGISKIFGYGEDAFTLWALKQHTSKILQEFQDKTAPSDCLIFYRPSFGRQSKESKAVFGEFDAIIASQENIYLIESKWDNLSKFDKDELILREEQELRHQILSWYLTHWNKKYSKDWECFVTENQNDFEFEGKTIAPTNSLLAKNLEFILTKSLKHCQKFSQNNIKNMMFFFYNAKKSKPPKKISRGFTLIPIDYSEETTGNFVVLYP